MDLGESFAQKPLLRKRGLKTKPWESSTTFYSAIKKIIALE